MPDLQVTSRSVNTVVEFTVSAPFFDDGVAVDYSDASVSALLHNTGAAEAAGARDALYRVDAGLWVVLPPGSKQSVTIDLSAQTLTMKRAQFASTASISMTVTGIPSGFYAGENELSVATEAAVLAALGYVPANKEGDTFTGNITTDPAGSDHLGFVVAHGGINSLEQVTVRSSSHDVVGAFYAIDATAFELDVTNGTGTIRDFLIWSKNIKLFMGASYDPAIGIQFNENGSATFKQGILLPTANPLIAGAWWDNAGTLTKSAG